MKKIKVNLGERSYDILIGSGLIAKAGAALKKLDIGCDACIITNKTLDRIYGGQLRRSLSKSGITSVVELVPDSEKAKSNDIMSRIIGRIGCYDKNKRLFIVALGGGVIGDLAGFIASIYKRGVPYVQIPTTLLAQVDSAIGGKVAIDLPIAKNLVGSFYQPRAVISDTNALRSLSKKQIRSGLSECIKYGIIKDAALFGYLEKNYKKALASNEKVLEHIVLSCSAIKARVVEDDEFDSTGKRAILNFGHTIGHAIEAAAGYSSRYNHGEAVAIGMAIASRISMKMELLSKPHFVRIENLLKRAGLPVTLKGVEFSRVYEAHLHDKKFIHGKNRFILPIGIGHVRVVEGIPDQKIIGSIKESMR